MTPETKCTHRVRDCVQILPGVQQCDLCGQLFLFIRGIGCGRYKKAEEITDEDRRNFSPEMEAEFLSFMRGGERDP